MKNRLAGWYFGAMVVMASSQVALAEDALTAIKGRLASQQLPLAAQALKEQNYQKAFSIYQHFASDGIAEAQYQLAWLYQRGLGTAKNDQLAAAWFMKAGAVLPAAQ